MPENVVRLGEEWIRTVDEIGHHGDPIVFIGGMAIILNECEATVGEVVHFEVTSMTRTCAFGEPVA